MKKLVNIKNSLVFALLIFGVSALDAHWVTDTWQAVKSAFVDDESEMIQQLRVKKQELLDKVNSLTGEQKQKALAQLAALKQQAQKALAAEQDDLVEREKLNGLSATQKAVLDKNIKSLKEIVESFKSQLGM